MSPASSASACAVAMASSPRHVHVERDLLLPLRGQHLRVEGAGAQHRDEAALEQRDVCNGRPGADRATIVVEHAHQRIAQVGGVGRRDVDRWPARDASREQVQVGEIGVLPGARIRLRDMQAQRLARSVRHPQAPRRDGVARVCWAA